MSISIVQKKIESRHDAQRSYPCRIKNKVKLPITHFLLFLDVFLFFKDVFTMLEIVADLLPLFDDFRMPKPEADANADWMHFSCSLDTHGNNEVELPVEVFSPQGNSLLMQVGPLL